MRYLSNNFIRKKYKHYNYTEDLFREHGYFVVIV